MPNRERPTLEYETLAPTAAHLNRLVQIAGKYTLDQLFEVGWGEIVFDVAPRGLRTPTLRQRGITFSVYYRLLDGDVQIETDRGFRQLPLRTRSVASFYEEFRRAANELGLSAPSSTLICEIPGSASTFEDDGQDRTWDHEAARLIWTGFDLASEGLQAWEAPYRGYRPRVGLMWGGFDLSATRYRARRTSPPSDRPPFLQHGITEEYVSVGFSFGSPDAPQVGLYAYIAPRPAGIEDRHWTVEGASWNADAGLVLLPWSELRRATDPIAHIVAFGDAVYDAAVDLAGWPADLVGPRFDGWEASRNPPGQIELQT